MVKAEGVRLLPVLGGKPPDDGRCGNWLLCRGRRLPGSPVSGIDAQAGTEALEASGPYGIMLATLSV